MKVAQTFEGRWWIFGNDKPEHFGVLQYNPGARPVLSVKITQSFGFGEIFSPLFEGQFSNVIHGRDKNDNPITLFGCTRTQSSKSGGLATCEFSSMYAIIGHAIDSWETAQYQKVKLHYSLLHKWVAKSCIVPKYAPDLVVNVQPRDAVEIKLKDGIVAKLNSEYFTNPVGGVFEIKEDHFMSFEFPQPMHIKTILKDYAEVLRRVLSLFIGEEVALESVEFEVSNGGEFPFFSELFQKNKPITRAKYNLTASEMIAPYKEMETVFSSVLCKWFEYHEKLDSVLNLYFAVLFNPSLYINHCFLFLAQALEVYHNSNETFTAIVLPAADFRTKRDKIINSVAPEERDWLKEKLHYANQKTLAQRLNDLLESNRTEAQQFIPDCQRFAEFVKNTRNYYTHFDEDLKTKGKVAEGGDMLLLVEQMKTLLTICILKDLGITGSPITRLIADYKELRLYGLS